MARRRKGRPVSGWVCLDKPLGLTSTSAVSRVRRVFEAQKAGHAGTLDPLATGILPIALGEATKTVPFLMDADKAYRFTIRWGETTASFDAEGEVVATSELRPTRSQVEAALPAFVGEVMQVPPAFSAIKVDGERAYDLARAGEVVELKARPVRIDSLAVTEQSDADHVTLEMVCGKGTYVRGVVRDLAEQLGGCGTLSMLRRTRVGRFTEDRAVTVEKLDALLYEGRGSEVLLPVETALDGILALALTDQEAADVRQGRPVVLLPRQREALSPDHSGPVAAFIGTRLQAICQIQDGRLLPVRVLHPDAED